MRATISPSGNCTARRVMISFTLDRTARVQLEVAKTGVRGIETVDVKTVRLKRGHRRISWTAPAGLTPRTYMLRLRVTDAQGRTSLY
jgi:hypothetical protein